ncbi:MAG: nicotinate (nicotinamide) nucleotide adenylyltransferase [Verrucomicrobiae bacterium]|nr:nicotinate (nicotinamide) nucleotide adenylyltransferase [Verrucomicrobiae bacterium]NNJ85836.1 nicotinate (nicotinamide) nucleotide adenylyltransferase [Akkermansiaceae bacterium]
MVSSERDEKKGRVPERVCLFGGTFDPIHLGHVHIAQAAVEQLHLDQVIFLPCRQSPHKPGHQHASETHRMAMCRLATEAFDWAQVDAFDMKAPEPSYSWRTAEAMTARFPNARLFWLMGTDQWEVLPQWNRPEHLAEMVEFIVFTRGAEPRERRGFKLHAISGNHPASATAIRESADKQLIKEWLHPNVARYISQNHLYQGHSQ